MPDRDTRAAWSTNETALVIVLTALGADPSCGFAGDTSLVGPGC